MQSCSNESYSLFKPTLFHDTFQNRQKDKKVYVTRAIWVANCRGNLSCCPKNSEKIVSTTNGSLCRHSSFSILKSMFCVKRVGRRVEYWKCSQCLCECFSHSSVWWRCKLQKILPRVKSGLHQQPFCDHSRNFA